MFVARRIVHDQLGAARLVQPVDLEVGGDSVLRAPQSGAAVDRQAGGFTAEHGCAQIELLHREALEIQSHRQVGKLGQAEGFVAGRRLRLGGRQALQRHVVDIEAADPEFAAEQGAGRPIQLRLIDIQPDAFIVGDGEVMDGDVQGPA